MSGIIAFFGGWLLLAILTAVLICRRICKAKQRDKQYQGRFGSMEA